MPVVVLVTPLPIFLQDERVFINLGILKIAGALARDGYPQARPALRYERSTGQGPRRCPDSSCAAARR